MAINSTTLSLIVCTIDNEDVLANHIRELITVASKVSYSVEILVVLGGGAVAPHIESLPKNITYKVIEEVEKGLYQAFNTGIEGALGDFIYFANVGDKLNYLPIALPQEFDMISFPVMICDAHFNHMFIRQPSDAKFLVPHHQGVFLRCIFYKKFKFDTRYRSAADLDFMIKTIKENPLSSYCDFAPPISLFTLGGISSSRKLSSIISRKTQRVMIVLRNRYFFPWLKFQLARLIH